MSALEWLDAVRADLDALARSRHVASSSGLTPDELTEAWKAVLSLEGRVATTAPDRLDRMERALRAVLKMHAIEVHWSPASDPSISYDYEADAREHDGCDPLRFEVCSHCGELETRNLEDVGYLDSIYPCPTVTTILEALGDE